MIDDIWIERGNRKRKRVSVYLSPSLSFLLSAILFLTFSFFIFNFSGKLVSPTFVSILVFYICLYKSCPRQGMLPKII